MKTIQLPVNVHIPTSSLLLISAGSVIVGIGVAQLFGKTFLTLTDEVIQTLEAL